MALQDSFIEEEEDTCPLCVEELDFQDRNFRPCPCGYQICQFCFNNIKNNMNGLCPACRRPYDEKTIEWKVCTQEEMAEFRANIQKNRKSRQQEQKQKEVQKREVEKENRKNLIGVRVVQKNLVYITGLAPTVREDELLKTLRKPEFFGQYGNIQKISISNRKGSDGQNLSLGIYVTFETPEEASRCIQAVNGSNNGDRVLKAQHGTTKYCSAWLKHEKCNNPGCMFLHEQGDEEDSYTRQDLSSMNSISTQRPLPGGGTTSRNSNRPQPPPQQVSVASTSSSQPMARTTSKEGSESGVDSSALPAAANWARNPQRSRRGSLATSGAASSPAVSSALPATSEAVEEAVETPDPAPAPQETLPTQETPVVLSKRASERIAEKAWKDILKFVSGCALSSAFSEAPEGRPMFDISGGPRRIAAREDESTGALDIAEERAEASADVVEAEPETGGSLALGGEPEDQDSATDGANYDQRRAQPPISRGNGDGMFGPALGPSARQNATNTPGRTMTPQQLFSQRSQAYGDPALPGVGGQGSFPGQGHGRQQSRFSFGNDNPSATTNVKLSANPRAMAQQHSMMPTTMQSQSGNQYYPSSVPAPPPGLKSTGTPPNMFGQGFGGSGFGGAPKDSSNELLQTLLGRTSRGGNSQVHDQGKREYMISSFSNQYPPSSSSTPAPAPGLLASLYGNQPGAYQEYGSKQKKKGKKHRHANTSSSGGSGLVDLVDPSILQARMHASQTNSGVGQGLFGGQSQVEDDILSMEEARESVDALVSEESDQVLDTSRSSRAQRESPTPRPSVPPGFSGAAQTSPEASMTQRQPITPVVPKAAQFHAPSVASTPHQTPTKSAASLVLPKRPGSSVSLLDNSQATSPMHSRTLNDEMFPALGTPSKEKRPQSPAVPAQPAPKKGAAPKKASQKAKTKATTLNLATMAEPSPSSVASSPALSSIVPAAAAAELSTKPEKATEGAAASSANFPPLPSTSGSSTPRTGPKTLRVLPSARVDSKSPVSPVASRTASIAQARPATPASEFASDTASLMSHSVPPSRSGSPPPVHSIVGSAAVRSTTKSQQRKERKDKLKQDTKAIAETVVKDEQAAHAPVLGRKKKQKKEQPPKAPKAPKKNAEKDTPPPLSPPHSAPQTPAKKEPKNAKDTKVTSESLSTTDKDQASTEESKPINPPTNSGSEMPANIVQEPIETDDPAEQQRNMGPGSIFQDIKSDLPKAADLLQMLKPVTGGSNNSKKAKDPATMNTSQPCSTTTCKCGEISEEDLAILRQGKPVWKNVHHDGSRMMITPNGDCFRNLSPAEETEVLDLQNRVGTSASNPGAFVANRHQPGAGAFSLIKGRAVPNGRPNIFPTSNHVQGSDPIGKLQREDALGYINQYILPPLNLGTSNTGAPKGVSPTRDAAAASLNSLAPYFYGPDAAAGVGIYSPPDGMRAMQDLAGPLGRSDDAAKNGAFGGPGAGSAMPIMSVEDAEAAMNAARQETEKLQKGLNQLIARNRALLMSSQ